MSCGFVFQHCHSKNNNMSGDERPSPFDLTANEAKQRELRKATKLRKLRFRKRKAERAAAAVSSFQEEVADFAAVVRRVEIAGLRRTRDVMVEAAVQDLFAASNIAEAVDAIKVVQGRLKALGCFK